MEGFAIQSFREHVSDIEMGGDIVDDDMTGGHNFSEIVPFDVQMLDARVEHSICRKFHGAGAVDPHNCRVRLRKI